MGGVLKQRHKSLHSTADQRGNLLPYVTGCYLFIKLLTVAITLIQNFQKLKENGPNEESLPCDCMS